MAKDLGDSVYGAEVNVKETSDGNGSAGDAVEIDGSGKVSPTDAASDDIYGVLKEDAPSDGESVTVQKWGDVIANAGGSVTKGDVLETSSTAGQLAQNSDSTGKATDVDGTTDQGVFAPANPEALSDSGATVEGASLGANEAHIFLK